MKTYKGPGDTIPYLNSGSAIASGAVIVLTASATAGHIGVASDDIAAGAAGALSVVGVHTLAKKAGDVFAQNDNAYWDSGNSYLTTTITGNTLAGLAWNTPVSADATMDVKINVR